MNSCTFFRLLTENEKSSSLEKKIESIKLLDHPLLVFTVDPLKFSIVAGSPFIYWINDRIRTLFATLPSFDFDERVAKQGLASADDFRFVRLWWEVSPNTLVKGKEMTSRDEYIFQTFQSKKWVPFVKGGEYLPYYSDQHLIINWEKNGIEIKNFEQAFVRNEDFYFQPGLTWSARAAKRGAFSVVPHGVIFSHVGMMIFAPPIQYWPLLGLLNSDAYIGLLHLLMPRGIGDTSATLKYEIGYVKSVPIPQFSDRDIDTFLILIKDNWRMFTQLEQQNETNHLFYSIGDFSERTIIEKTEQQTIIESRIYSQLVLNTEKLNDFFFNLYGINQADKQILLENVGKELVRDETANQEKNERVRLHAKYLISYLLGCTFGRWDIRFATREKQPPPLPDPFAPLPPCSPGMLQGEDGLPLTEPPTGYPLPIDPDGILVDDPDHPDDIIRKIREALKIIYGDRAEAIEQEACQILGIRDIREYFRKPGAKGFWDDHIKTYSKSRRKAPIYWLFQSSRKNYAVWLYYPKLNADTLFLALERYVKPKVLLEERRLSELVTARQQLSDNRDATRRSDLAIEKQQSLVQELTEFRDKLEKAAKLYLVPDHDDGVVLNIAPLHELVPWKEAAKYWGELIEGKYPWSSIGKQLKEKGIIK